MLCHRICCTCRFAHDAVRLGDTAFVASTGDGAILELGLPGCDLLHRYELFTAQEHVNALAPVGNGSMWALLHKHGQVCQNKISDCGISCSPTHSVMIYGI
jgi:hypothetical protein